MTLAEAAAALAEAKEVLRAALKAEEAAWDTLQAIAGRKADARPTQDPTREAGSIPVIEQFARAKQTWQEQTVPIPPKVVG